MYRAWDSLVPANTQLWSVLYPGREARFKDPFATDFSEIVAGVVDEIKQLQLNNVVLFGHSMGAHFATKTASALVNETPSSVKSLLVSGIHPPSVRKLKLWADASDDELMKHVIELGAMPAEVADDPSFVELYLEKIRADYRVYESVPADAPEAVDLPMVAIRGEEDPLVEEPLFAQWQQYSTQPVEMVTFAGGHFYFEPYHKPLLRVISNHIRGL